MIWSMGRVLLTMSADQEATDEEISLGQLPSMSAFYGSRLHTLIKETLSVDAAKRPQADAILRSEVIT